MDSSGIHFRSEDKEKRKTTSMLHATSGEFNQRSSRARINVKNRKEPGLSTPISNLEENPMQVVEVLRAIAGIGGLGKDPTTIMDCLTPQDVKAVHSAIARIGRDALVAKIQASLAEAAPKVGQNTSEEEREVPTIQPPTAYVPRRSSRSKKTNPKFSAVLKSSSEEIVSIEGASFREANMENSNDEKKVDIVLEGTEKPKINYRGVKVMPFIIGNETFEKLGTIGTSSNFLVYLTTVFNLKNVTAATIVNVFNGTTNLTPLLGAYFSDAFFGRFLTLGFASISSLAGMFVLMLTAAITKLHPPKCTSKDSSLCVEPTTWQMAFLLCGFAFLIVGAGGIRPCNLAFGADQFNPNTEAGKRGINSFFNWYYFTFTFAMMISVTLIVYVQSSINWAIGFGIPTFLMLLSVALFFMGSRLYVKVKPEGSPITGIVQVFVAASKKKRLKLPDNPQLSLFNFHPTSSINTKLPHTDQFRFLDKAAIITDEDKLNPDGSAVDPWRLSRMQQIEEVKCVIRVIPIWASGIIYYAAIVQQNTYAVYQTLQSDRNLGSSGFQVPAASYIVFTMLSLTIWIPVYDRIIVPSLRNITGKEGGITLLQRMGVGVVLSILSMIVSALVEERRQRVAHKHPFIGYTNKGGGVSGMSGFWLIPQLTLAGLSEAFNSVGQVEFYYKQFPENMRSIAGSFFFCGMAGANYLSGLMVSIVHQTTDWLPEDLNKGRLDYFYYMIAILGVVNFGYFLVCARWYRYKGNDGSATVEMSMDSRTIETDNLDGN